MTGWTSALLVAALSVAALDWYAVLRRNKVIEYACKPLAAVLFLACALAIEPAHGSARAWLAVALVFCVLGDVFLMLPRDAFVPGLASFAVAQVLFAVSFAVSGISTGRLIGGSIVVVAGSAVLARRFIAALRGNGQTSLIPPVTLYMTVIGVMVVSAVGAGSALAGAGAVLFMVSDSLIAEERFVRSRRWQPKAIIVTYHLALAGLVLGLV